MMVSWKKDPKGHDPVDYEIEIQDDFQKVVWESIKRDEMRMDGKIETFHIDPPILYEKYEIPRSQTQSLVIPVWFNLNDDTSLPLICRLCATRGNDMIYIFGPTVLQKNIADQIKRCLPAAVNKTDALPKQVCRLCIEKLELYYQFHKTVTQAEKQFLNICDKKKSTKFEQAEVDRIYEYNVECVTVRDSNAESKLTAANSDEGVDNNESITDPTVDNNIASLNSKRYSNEVNNLSRESRRKSPRNENQSIELSPDGLNSKIISVNPEEDESDSENYSPPITRSGKTSDCQEKQAGQRKSHDNIQLPCGEAITSTESRIVANHDPEADKLECNECGEKFTSKENLAVHKLHRISCTLKTCYCKRCDAVLDSARSLESHMLAVHSRRKKCSSKGKKEFSCHYCGKVFNLKTNLACHIRIHTGEKPYICDLCSKGFIRKVSRDEHRRIHTGERPYKCDICKNTFRSAQSLTIHSQYVHSKKRPYKCSLCGKSYKSPAAKYQHICRHK